MNHLLPFAQFKLNEDSTVDAILDKIAQHGMAALTPNERRYLDSKSSGEKLHSVYKGQEFNYRIGHMEFTFIYDHSAGIWDHTNMSEDVMMPTHYGRIHTDEQDYAGHIIWKDNAPINIFVREDEDNVGGYDEDEGYPSITFEEDHPELAEEFTEIMGELAERLNDSLDHDSIH